MRYEVTGTIMQTVSIDLVQGESLYSQTASMAWMNRPIRMDSHTSGGILGSIMGDC